MEILYTYSYMHSNGGDLLFGIFGALAGIVIFLGIIATRKNNSRAENIVFSIVAMIFLFASLSILVPTITHPKIEHDVVIKEMRKFDTNKYQIIEQKGKVFKVKEIR